MTGSGLAAGLAVLAGSAGVGWAAARLGVAIALRRMRGSESLGWVERARLAYPARLVIAGDRAAVTLGVGAIAGCWVAPGLGLDPMAWGSLAGLAALGGVLAAGLGLERRLCRPSGGRAGITLATLFLPPLLVPFGLMLAFMPEAWGWPAAAVLASGLALATFHIRCGWLGPLRWLGLARPASPRLAAAVASVAGRMGARVPATFELDSPQANAIAWPAAGVLVFTGPALEALDDAGLASIVAHELGHLDEPRGSLLIRAVPSYFLIACGSYRPLMNSFGALAGLAPLVALLSLALVGRRLGRRMEERSDRLGREHEGESPGTYARALEAIYRANLMPAASSSKRGKGVHPDLHDRLIAAGVTPDYPRPDPPPRIGLAALPAILLALAGWAAFLVAMSRSGTPQGR